MIIRVGCSSQTLHADSFEDAVAVIRAYHNKTGVFCAYYLEDDDGKYLGRFSNPRFWVGGHPDWEPFESWLKRS